MPYDPNWDLEGDAASIPANYDSVPESHGWISENVVEEDASHPWFGEQHRVSTEEPMDLDDQSEPTPTPLHQESRLDTPPTSRLPFPGAEALAKQTLVEVVLHSTPRRHSYIAPSEDLEESTAERESEVDMVKSDLLPKPKRRGRPPKNASAASTPGPTSAPAPEPAPSATAAPATTTQPLPAPAPKPQAQTATLKQNKRGRPFGWKPGLSYSALRAGLVAPSSSASTPKPKPKKPTAGPKPRSRPGRKPALTARQIYLKLNPHFLTFRCEWENCPAELQNIETLRKHMLIVHGKRPLKERSSVSSSSSPPTITCRWRSCPAAAAAEPFPSLEAFTAHVDTVHIPPFLWHLGDGPRNSTPSADILRLTPSAGVTKHRIIPSTNGTGASTHRGRSTSEETTTTTSTTNDDETHPAAPKLPPYLFNAAGEQVTPSIHDQQLETDEDRRRRAARVHRVLVLQNLHAPEEPVYTAREMAAVAEAVREKQARRKMFEEYAEWIEKMGEEGEKWKVK
ncbi:hypothetical protein VTJ04DRAFT_8905 [Mycothermus thermophilus]|uniref:uncharacterized protein n=1 Tax=Humicola insolens TaxID=85995 RepID=UPI00374358DF